MFKHCKLRIVTQTLFVNSPIKHVIFFFLANSFQYLNNTHTGSGDKGIISHNLPTTKAGNSCSVYEGFISVFELTDNTHTGNGDKDII